MKRIYRFWFVIGAQLGFLWLLKQIRRPQKLETDRTPEEIIMPPVTTTESPAISSNMKSAKDDLTRIWGIGSKINETLLSVGIDTFEKLAQLSPEQLRAILLTGKARMIKAEYLIDQASLAATGDWEKLEKLISQYKNKL